MARDVTNARKHWDGVEALTSEVADRRARPT